MAIIVALVTGLVVWHFTRVSQARAAIRTRRNQIRGLWREIRTFVFRGIFVVVAFGIVMYVALRY